MPMRSRVTPSGPVRRRSPRSCAVSGATCSPLTASSTARDSPRSYSPIVARAPAPAVLAPFVFADRGALDDLEPIIHPEVRRMIADGIRSHLDTDDVVVLVNPLLIEMGTPRDCAVVVVVSAAPETQVARSVGRGMDEADARARIDAQLPLEDRARAADVLVDNEGTPEELEAEVEGLWHDLAVRADDGR